MERHRRLLDLWEIGDESFELLIRSLKVPVTRSSPTSYRAMLGDDLVASANFADTCHAEARAAPKVVWSWICQMMRGGGIYGWSRLEGRRSHASARLLRDLAEPCVGDQVDALLEVCRLAPGSEIVWRSIDPIEFLDATISSLTLDYAVEPLHPSGSRVVARMRCHVGGHRGAIGTYAAGTLFNILPRCQVREIVKHADGEHGREAGPPFQAVAFLPAAAGMC